MPLPDDCLEGGHVKQDEWPRRNFIQIVSRLAVLRLSSDSNGVRTMLACFERSKGSRLPSEYQAAREKEAGAGGAAGLTVAG